MTAVWNMTCNLAKTGGNCLVNCAVQLKNKSVDSTTGAYKSLRPETRTSIEDITITAIAAGVFYFLQETAATYLATEGWGVCAAKLSLTAGCAVGMQAVFISVIACSIIRWVIIPSFVSQGRIPEASTGAATEKNPLLKRAVRLATYFAGTCAAVGVFSMFVTRPSIMIRRQADRSRAATQALVAQYLKTLQQQAVINEAAKSAAGNLGKVL
ncbi:MAG: hypothetical protein KDK50_02945 [Chlamydiia bacterium]|nr:hypothetical protein [Chlamydiia bacterium]